MKQLKKQKITLILLILSASLIGGSSCTHGTYKVYNVDKDKGLVRKNGDDVVPFGSAHHNYGCMRWEDIQSITEVSESIKDIIR